MTVTATSAWDPTSPAPAVVRVFGDFRFHTDGDVLAVAFVADGALCSVEEPGVLRHWNPETGQQRDWQFLSDLETLWAFSADGRVLVSASNDLSLWDVSSGQLLTAVPQPAWVTALAFRADPTFLATGHDDGVVRLWDAAGHHLVREFRGDERPVSAIAFSPDGARLAAASEDKIIYLWDCASGKQLGTFVGHTDRIHALLWHPRGDRLVSAGWDTTARVWDAATLQPVILLNTHATQITAVAFSPDGALLACADSADAIHVWDFATSKERFVLKGHTDQIGCLTFSRDGQRLASGGSDRVVRLWDLKQGQLFAGRGDFESSALAGGFQRLGSSVAVHADNRHLACSTGGSGLEVWDTRQGQRVAGVEADGVLYALAYSPDGRWIAGGVADGRIRLWDAATHKLRATLEDEDQVEPVTTLAFTADSGLLASAGATGTAVWLWQVPAGEPALLIPDAIDGCTVEAVAFHPQGKLLAAGGIDWLATGGSDGAIALWDITERCEVALFDGGSTSLDFHPSGRSLASASLASSVCIWDVEDRRLAAELTGHEDTVTCVRYSRDGRWLASGGDDRTLRLWDATTLKPAAAVDLDTQIKTLAFSPDGRYLYTGNGNTTCYQFDVQRLLSEHAAE
jgi:WD40 repeat protein